MPADDGTRLLRRLFDRLRGRYAFNIAAAVVVVSAVLLGAGALAVDQVQGSVESNAREAMMSSAEREAQGIDGFVEDMKGYARRVSSSSGVQSINEATDQQAESTQETVSMIDEVAEVSAETASEAQNVSAAAEEQTAAIGQISASAESLSSRADELRTLADEFEAREAAAAEAGTGVADGDGPVVDGANAAGDGDGGETRVEDAVDEFEFGPTDAAEASADGGSEVDGEAVPGDD